MCACVWGGGFHFYPSIKNIDKVREGARPHIVPPLRDILRGQSLQSLFLLFLCFLFCSACMYAKKESVSFAQRRWAITEDS